MFPFCHNTVKITGDADTLRDFRKSLDSMDSRQGPFNPRFVEISQSDREVVLTFSTLKTPPEDWIRSVAKEFDVEIVCIYERGEAEFGGVIDAYGDFYRDEPNDYPPKD